LKLKRKALTVIVTISMLIVLLVPLAAPAGAYSLNHINKVIPLADDFVGETGAILTIKEDTDFVNDFVNGDMFQLVLPSDVKWNNPTVVGDVDYEVISDQIMELTFTDGVDEAAQDEVKVYLNVEIDGAIGDIAVEVDEMDSGVTGGTYVFVRVPGRTTNVKVLSVKTIGDPGWGGDIQIEEASLGSLGTSSQHIRLKLPKHFDWNMSEGGTIDPDDQVSFSGGFSGMTLVDRAGANPGYGNYDVVVDGDTLYIYFEPISRTTRGIITVKTPINPSRDANYGDVELNIDGSVATFSSPINTEFPNGSVSTDKVGIPSPEGTKNITLFKIGSMYYTVNGVQMAMDVAPYIDDNDRALLPIRFVANATGISDSNIFWDATDRSVTLVGSARKVMMLIGSTAMWINGVESRMDTVPVIAGPGRTMLPIRYAAQALDCDITWDATTQTITITQTVAAQ
jgi:hypothetical protein